MSLRGAEMDETAKIEYRNWSVRLTPTRKSVDVGKSPNAVW